MTIASKYQGFCNTCHYTYFKNEQVRWDGNGTSHVDCLTALSDKFPRTLSKRYRNMYGNIPKKKMKNLLLSMGASPQTPDAC